MKDNLTEIVFIIDRSGSMHSIRQDVIGGFNSFIEEQKKVKGEANVSLFQFDDQYESVYENIDLNSVENLTEETFVPRGMTALLDAVGKTVTNVGIRLSNIDESERPSKVMIVIITDGEENSSKEYTNDRIKEMITHQEEKYSWDFIFIAANMDATKVAANYGIAGNKTMNYAATTKGVSDMTDTLNLYTTAYRCAKSSSKSDLNLASFKDEEDDS